MVFKVALKIASWKISNDSRCLVFLKVVKPSKISADGANIGKRLSVVSQGGRGTKHMFTYHRGAISFYVYIVPLGLKYISAC